MFSFHSENGAENIFLSSFAQRVSLIHSRGLFQVILKVTITGFFLDLVFMVRFGDGVSNERGKGILKKKNSPQIVSN